MKMDKVVGSGKLTELDREDAQRYRWLRKMWTTTLLDGSEMFGNAVGIKSVHGKSIEDIIDFEMGRNRI